MRGDGGHDPSPTEEPDSGLAEDPDRGRDGRDAGSRDRRAGLDGVSRRQFLLGGGATLAAVGAGKAAHNTVLGYGQLGMGTNLHEQDLPAVVAERLAPSYDETFGGRRLWVDLGDPAGIVAAFDGGPERLLFDEDGRAEAAALDRDLDLDGRLEALFVDVAALQDGRYTFEFSQPEAFFERLEGAPARSEAVAALRGQLDRVVDPAVVERFAGADPTDPEAVVDGLVEGFREHASYDVPRYLAGSVEDNVIFGARDLRASFEDDVDFESLLAADGTGMFCGELCNRAEEALQAVAPREQAVPVATCYVRDRRHKHAYTGVASALREDADGELRLPMTFVDYTYSTLYDDFHLTGVRGEGLAAYDDSHRADDIYW